MESRGRISGTQCRKSSAVFVGGGGQARTESFKFQVPGQGEERVGEPEVGIITVWGAKLLTQHSWDSWARGGQELGVPEDEKGAFSCSAAVHKVHTGPRSDTLPVLERVTPRKKKHTPCSF